MARHFYALGIRAALRGDLGDHTRLLMEAARRTADREAFHLIEDVAAMRMPVLALTGGDPLKRPGLFPILEFAPRPLGSNISDPVVHAAAPNRHQFRLKARDWGISGAARLSGRSGEWRNAG